MSIIGEYKDEQFDGQIQAFRKEIEDRLEYLGKEVIEYSEPVLSLYGQIDALTHVITLIKKTLPIRMTYEEAQEKSLTVPWKVVPCHVGESCWCRMIEPAEPIMYGDEEYILVGSGSIGEELANYLVNLHNQSLNGK